MNDYAYIAKEITKDTSTQINVDIGIINNIDPIAIKLSDITLDQDDIILTDKISKLIKPIIPDVECDNNCKIKEDIYNDDKLNIGDKVILNPIEGGQRYIVIDRIYL